MILELAILKIAGSQQSDFEPAFCKAQAVISSVPGYISHQLQRCLETPGKYVLPVNRQRLEDHAAGFRQSEPYGEWKRLPHHFYDPFPTVGHFEMLYAGSASSV